jgi:(-)-germacrene D synthase
MKTQGLLSLYNAAHLLLPNESILEEAINFTRDNLKKKVINLKSPLDKQVVRALKSPLPRFMKRLEARFYIDEYEEQEAPNDTILEFAKLDFNAVQREHCKELKALTS